MLRRLHLGVLGTVALAMCAAAPSPAAAQRQPGTIAVSGSTTTRPLLADLVYFYRREHPRAPRFSITGGGSEIGLSDAARRIVDAGMVSRDLEPGDPGGLTFTPIAYSAICFATNLSNRVPNVTRAQIQDLVAARLTSWAAVPGSTRTDAIVTVGHDRTAAARSLFYGTFVDLDTPSVTAVRTFRTASQVHDFIAATPGAWGYIDFAYMRGLHGVAYEGVPCTRAAIVSGAYRGRRPLGLATRGRPRGELARFLRWVKRDATAKRVIATRYIPAA